MYKIAKFSSCLVVFCLAAITLPAQAYPDGISWASGSGGSDCTGCHSGGTYSYLASLSATGGTLVERSTAVTITFSVSKLGGADAKDTGLNVASPSGGTLTEGSALLQLMVGENGLNEITHMVPQPSNSLIVNGGNVVSPYTWPSFTWTSPASSGDFILYGCGNMVNGSRQNPLDGTGSTGDNPACTTLTMTVNNAPSIFTTGTTGYTENAAAITVHSTANITDTETDLMQTGSVTITNAQTGDRLNINAATCTANQLVCSGSGTSTITISGGPESIVEFEAVMQAVTYDNTSDNPSTVTRTVQFYIEDTYGRSDTSNRSITFTAVNDAPVISVDGTPTFTENSNPGPIIDSTITITDAESNSIVGATVSITGNFNSSQDTLDYTTTNGITGSYSSGTGVLTLTGTTTLANYEGALEVVRYRNTSDNPTTGARTISFVVTDNGTPNEPSVADTASVAISASNDAPVISNVDNIAAFVENSPAVTIDSAVSISDADSTLLNQALVSITANFSSSEDVLVYSTVNGITGSYSAGTGVLTLSHAGTTLAAFEQALESVQYNNTSDTPSTLTRTISMVVRDTTNVSSVADTTTVTVASTNDAPVVSGVDSGLLYTEEDPATVIDGTISVTDPDTANCDQATVDLSTNYQSTEDVLAYSGSVPGISAGAFNSGTGTITLSGTAACSDYATALEFITFENTSLNPNTAIRTVEFQVRDASSLLSNVDTTTITISATSTPPEITNVDDVAAFTENGGAVTIDSAVSISDPDSTLLNQATVSITGNFASGEDALVYSTLNGITGSYSSGTGVLTLSHAGATLAAFEQALESVQYNNTSENPSTLTRTLSFVVRDTANVSSTADTTTLTVAAANDAPAVSVDNSSAPSYTENGSAVVLDSTITVSDVDTADQINQALVSITGNFNSSEDELVYSTVNGITGSYVSGTGVLTLTGTTSRANYEGALETVAYRNNSENPNTSTRTVSFVVRDTGAGTLSSAADTVTVAVNAVNDSPVISGVDNTANYTENGAAVVIDSAVSISDVDSTQLNGATVSITGNFNSAQDELVYSTVNGITGTYDSPSGVLTLTHAGTTLAAFEQALGSVEYRNNSDNPTTGARTIAMRVRDSGNAVSTPDTTTLSITAVNDAPVAVNDSGAAFNVAVNSADNELDVLANDTDVEGDGLSIISVTPVTVAPGSSVSIGDGGVCALDTVCYTPAPDYTDFFVFTYTIEDDGVGNLTDTATVTVGGTDTDGDTIIDFLDNCPSDINAGQENNDGDGQGDVCDTDDDNDGMPDTFENTYDGVNGCELDPLDPSDANEDCDGDGLSNLEEANIPGSDPTVDDVVPAFNGVQDITVNSTGYLTAVNLGTIRAVDGADGTVVITVDSVTGSTSQDYALNGLFRPGTTVITRSAQDSQANVANSVQTINVRPLANFAPDQITVEGNTGVVARVYLNGEVPSPDPVTLEYSVSGTSNGSDYIITPPSPLTFNPGDVTADISIDFNSDGTGEGDETLILTLSNPESMVLGARKRHTITIAEGNVAPAVTLSVLQGANEGSLISDGAGPVVVTANVSDPNAVDTATFDWSGSPTPTGGTGTSLSATFEFDPAIETLGSHSIAVEVTDSAGATATAEVFLYLMAAADVPVLVSGVDADADGIEDDVDGFSDDDADGIPNYLDAYEQGTETNLIQNQTGDLDAGGLLQNVMLVQAEPGFHVRKGPVAMYGNASGIMVSEDDIMDYADANGVAPSSADDDMVNIGGIYDFEISNMLPGTTARVVLPLSARILEGATYRKFSLQNGWQDFSTSGANAIASARASRGVCPAPGHSSYRSGLNVFDNCIELTMVDGGPNDADGEANGVIRDPGGAAVTDPSPVPEQEEPADGSGGGVLHPFWLLLLALWGALRIYRSRRCS